MRCEAEVTKHYANNVVHRKDMRCRRIADFAVGNKRLCTRHAGMRLLERAKTEGAVKRVPRIRGEREYRRAEA